MANYLGEFPVDISQTEYANYGPAEWAAEWIAMYGQFDGGHHKMWTLDHAMRILKGTPVIVTLAKWDDGQEEYRFDLGEPSQAYTDFVAEYERGDVDPEEIDEDDEDYEPEYSWDTGIAP